MAVDEVPKGVTGPRAWRFVLAHPRLTALTAVALGCALALVATLAAAVPEMGARRVPAPPAAAGVDALFIPPPPGTRPYARFAYDAANVAAYVGTRELRAYRGHGFRRLVSRSYYGLKEGGVVVTLVEASDPSRLLTGLARARRERHRAAPLLPHGQVRDTVAELGDGAIAYSRTFGFVHGPYAAQVTGWDYGRPESRTRAQAAAVAQLALLRQRLN